MLLSRDYVGHMAKEVIKRLVAGKMIEVQHLENVTTQVRQVMGASYQEMYKKVKGQLARERKLILR